MRCKRCARPVKPEIVFFGESLPEEFHEAKRNIKRAPDLCLIMGTALAVAPFNMLPLEVP